MLEKNQIASASQTLHDHWRAGTKLAALEEWHAPVQPRRRLCHPGGNPNALPRTHLFGWKIAATSEAGQSTSMSTARWPDAFCAETVIPDGGTAIDGGQRNARRRTGIRLSHEGRLAAARSRPTPCRRCSTRSTRCIRRSRFRTRALPILSAPATRSSSPTMPARICSCWARRRRRTGARSTWSSRGPVIAMRGKQFIGHGKNVLGDPRIALTWLANELRQLGVTLERAGEVVTTGTCHPPLPIRSGDVFEADFGVIGKVSVGFA